jgi:pyridinium-3,5-bisthiocarboxylic acid mononucleotide nickel chelatase
MRVLQIGYGAGSRNPKDFPNVLRLSLGDSADATHSAVAVLETAIDDLSPQILAHVTERALALGALDVMSTAVQMKKGRLGTLLTILADDATVPALENLLLRETSTLGVRIHHERRSCLDRTHTTVTTPYGDIRIKIGSRNNETYNAAPEFEDCRAAAAKHNVPVKQVQQAAIAAYLR